MRSFRSRTVSSRSLLSQPTVLKLSQPVALTPSLECLWRSNWSIEVVGSDRRWNPALIESVWIGILYRSSIGN